MCNVTTCDNALFIIKVSALEYTKKYKQQQQHKRKMQNFHVPILEIVYNLHKFFCTEETVIFN